MCGYWRTKPSKTTTGADGQPVVIKNCPKCGGDVYKSPKFTIQYYGKSGRKKTKTLNTKKEAEAILATVVSDKQKRKLFSALNIVSPPENLPPEKMKPDGRTPFDEMAKTFHTPRTRTIKDPNREAIAIRHLVGFFGNKPIGDILPMHLREYQHHRQGQTVLSGQSEVSKYGRPVKRVKPPRNVKASTAGRELRVLRMIILYAKANKFLEFESDEDYPFYKFKFPEDREIVHIITQEQKQKLYSFLPKNSQPLFEFLAESGCRISEAMSLTWSNVRHMKKRSRLRDTKSQRAKGGTEELFLSPMAWQIVESQPRLSEYVFTNPKTKTRYTSLGKSFRQAAIEADLIFDGEPLRPHDLRHNLLTEIAETEVSESTLLLISRHKDPKSLQRYLHRNKQKAAENAFLRLVESRQQGTGE